MNINRKFLIWLFPLFLIADFLLAPVKSYWFLLPLGAFLLLLLLQKYLKDARYQKHIQWGFMAIVLGYVIFFILLPNSKA